MDDAWKKEVELEDGTTVSYTIRGLVDDEIVSWAEFCASVFAYKANPPPPTYFERHYTNDPSREASLIRVAFCGSNIVASVRVFLRRVSIQNGESWVAGGIGEVCTHSAHRRRGLSKFLLQDARNKMADRGLQVSLLHAAPAFFPVYEKAGGYACTTTKWTIAQVKQQQQATNNTEGFNIRSASFPIDTDRLSSLHKVYSEDRFVGCIIRSKDYWNDYLSKELEGSLCVMTNSKNVIIAWWSVRPRGDRYQLREFGVDQTLITTAVALANLLQFTLNNLGLEDMTLALPTVVVDEVNLLPVEGSSSIDWTILKSEDDLGWMYKTIQGKLAGIDSVLSDGSLHLIWPSDSF